MKKITIEDVAKRAKVSKGTVSAVINAKNTVKQSTRDHILEIMKELNFRPKGVARDLKNNNQNKSIGIIIKDLNYPFYTSIATGAKEYADERVIHYGIIPRSNRGIFVINELPDLQARIQVSLFNILEEGDLQIRGFKLRLPLDIMFVFTANPEDYTNRGAIVTPLKDRIESQILTHYPTNIENSLLVTEQEASIHSDQVKKVQVSDLVKRLLEQVSFEARGSEFVDKKSGVSARLTISAFENAVSAAERRAIMNKEKETQIWISDLTGIIPSITGKIEFVYEGEQEGPYQVAYNLLEKAIRTQFVKYFPNPESLKKEETANLFRKKILTGPSPIGLIQETNLMFLLI